MDPQSIFKRLQAGENAQEIRHASEETWLQVANLAVSQGDSAILKSVAGKIIMMEGARKERVRVLGDLGSLLYAEDLFNEAKQVFAEQMAITDLSLSQTQPQEIAKTEDQEIAENVQAVAPKRRGRPPKRASVVAPTEDNSSKRNKVTVWLPPIDSGTISQQLNVTSIPDTPEKPSASTSVVPEKRGRGRPRKTASVRLPTPPKLEPKTEIRNENGGPSARTRASTGAVSDSLPSTSNSQSAVEDVPVAPDASSVAAPANATIEHGARPTTRSSTSSINGPGLSSDSEEAGQSRRLPPVRPGVIDGRNIPQHLLHPWGWYENEEGLAVEGPV